MSLFWIDGTPAELTPEQLKLFDPASPETFGAFETLRTYGGKLFKVDQHLARLQHSANLLGFTPPHSLEKIAAFLERSTQESATELRVKCVATPSHILIQSTPLLPDPAVYEGVSAVSFAATREQPEAKALPYNLSFEAHAFAESQGAAEAILLDEEGLVTEGAYSNIFWVKNGTIYTRKDGVLQGITRAAILEQHPVEFQKITLAELQNADELLLTKTTTGPAPITKLNGLPIGTGKPGLFTVELISTFRKKSA